MKNWIDIAAVAEEARRNAKHGKREAAMNQFVPGVDVEVVRRTIRVTNFLDELTKKNTELAQALRSQPFYHLQILQRWAVLDMEAAIVAAREMLKNKPTLRALQADFEAYRRRKGEAGPITRLTPTRPLLAAIGQLLHGNVSDPQIRPTVLGGRLVDMTLKLDQGSLPSSKVAVTLVGPYGNPQHYIKRMHNALLNAWALAWVFEDVVLALPQEASVEAYRRWLIDAQGELGPVPAAGPRVHLLAMEAKFYGPQRAVERE